MGNGSSVQEETSKEKKSTGSFWSQQQELLPFIHTPPHQGVGLDEQKKTWVTLHEYIRTALSSKSEYNTPQEIDKILNVGDDLVEFVSILTKNNWFHCELHPGNIKIPRQGIKKESSSKSILVSEPNSHEPKVQQFWHENYWDLRSDIYDNHIRTSLNVEKNKATTMATTEKNNNLTGDIRALLRELQLLCMFLYVITGKNTYTVTNMKKHVDMFRKPNFTSGDGSFPSEIRTSWKSVTEHIQKTILVQAAEVKAPDWQEKFSFKKGDEHVYIYLLGNDPEVKLLYLNTSKMSRSSVIKELKSSSSPIDQELISYLSQITVEAIDKVDFSKNVAKCVNSFLEIDTDEGDECYPGLGVLVLIKTGEDGYHRVVSACTFEKDRGNVEGRTSYYIDTVANLKNDLTPEQKRTIRKTFPESFCTYLIERTSSVLNQKLDVFLFHLFNHGGQSGFRCYTKAALLANLVPFQFLNEKKSSGIRPQFRNYLRENTTVTPTFYRTLEQIINAGEDHYDKNNALGWYDETKLNPPHTVT